MIFPESEKQISMRGRRNPDDTCPEETFRPGIGAERQSLNAVPRQGAHHPPEHHARVRSLLKNEAGSSFILAAGEIFLYRFYYEPSFIPSSHRLGALRRSLRNIGESPFRHQKRYGGLHHLQPRRRVPPDHMQRSGKLPLRNLVRQREEQGTLHGSQSPGLLPAP